MQKGIRQEGKSSLSCHNLGQDVSLPESVDATRLVPSRSGEANGSIPCLGVDYGVEEQDTSAEFELSQ